ncbi:8-oxo-dGTP diphosphatase [halophilic archaeon]|nr:8-oxo-dGTP diphosphatase [halophilic archaeon]
MQHATLCYPIEDERVLLIRKKRGLGDGKYVGPGGKLEAGETPRECVVREVEEEVGVTVRDPEKVGEFRFVFGDDPRMYVHVFRTYDFEGTPTETPEADPEWFAFDDVPYDEMWDDDRLWLPHLFEGETFEGTFRFDADGEEMVDHELTFGVAL